MTRVRPATPADAPAMCTLHTAAVHELGSTAYDADQVEAWAAPDAVRDGFPFDDPRHYLVVATHDGGEVAGFGQLHAPDREVVADYVHPDHARRGVGSALLAHLEGYARGRGFDHLELTASINAVDFYEHHATRSSKRPNWTGATASRGVVLPVAVMEKQLP